MSLVHFPLFLYIRYVRLCSFTSTGRHCYNLYQLNSVLQTTLYQDRVLLFYSDDRTSIKMSHSKRKLDFVNEILKKFYIWYL